MDSTRATSFDDIVRLREAARTGGGVGQAVELVRDFLGMDIAYATKLTDTEQLFEVLRGDGESFGLGEGSAVALEQTYCQRVLAGRLPNLIPDVRGDRRAASLPVTEAADVGAFVSVPLELSDGRLYGTLCAASHETHPELGSRELEFLYVFARLIADQVEREQLQAKVHRRDREVTAATALVAAVEARDASTVEHSRAVLYLAIAVAEQLGLEENEVDDVARVAMLHDIGKISTPDAILHKAGPLTEAEWEVMRRHPVDGERLIASTPGLEYLAPAIRAAHERWDGAGYPDRLEGAQIPITSRIILACDAYNAMVSDRAYRRALPVEAAVREVSDNAGSQFDPVVAEVLLRVVETGKTISR